MHQHFALFYVAALHVGQASAVDDSIKGGEDFQLRDFVLHLYDLLVK